MRGGGWLGRAGRVSRRMIADIARQPNGWLALGLAGGLVVVVVLAPWLTPYAPETQEIANRLQGPSVGHPLGTDNLGRDLLTRTLYGARIALSVAIPAGLIALLLGLVLGLSAGYVGGRTDDVIVVLMDTLQSLQPVPFALVLLLLLGSSLLNVILVVGIAFAPAYARMARASVFVTKEEAFVEAERSLGAGDLRILLRHILPNVIAPLFILMAINIPVAITIEAGLSFLGLGLPPPTPSWGNILADGFGRIRETPWPVIAPALALMLTTLGFTLLGEALRDRLDPRLSGSQQPAGIGGP